MLSILIPTYNYCIFPLVQALQKQCEENNLVYEIIGIDDGSNSVLNLENENINLLENCAFIPLSENIGLSENRNLLATKAKYPNLLFIDGDSIIIAPNYIKNYLDSIEANDIVYGGRVHPEMVASPKQQLRWKYGRYIEDKTADQRNLSVFKTLMFNNTAIKKNCFDQIKFDANLKKYGHEDTLFAYQASVLNLKVLHIENAIEHGDIDESAIFILKVKNSLNNLFLLDKENKIKPGFIKILRLYHFLRNYKLQYLAAGFFMVSNKILYKKLISKNPSLFLFNLYRIGYFCSINSKI